MRRQGLVILLKEQPLYVLCCLFRNTSRTDAANLPLQFCLSNGCFSPILLIHFLPEMSNPQCVHLLSETSAARLGTFIFSCCSATSFLMLVCVCLCFPRPLGLEFPAASLWASRALAHMKYRVWGLGVHLCPCRKGDVFWPLGWGSACGCLSVHREEGLAAAVPCARVEGGWSRWRMQATCSLSSLLHSPHICKTTFVLNWIEF